MKAAFKSGIILHEDICKLTQDEAKLIYRKNFWDKFNWSALEWPVCLCYLDCCINHDGFASILQRAAIEYGQSVVFDGKFGPKIFAALKACNPQILAGAIYRQRVNYYEKIIVRNPKQAVFRLG